MLICQQIVSFIKPSFQLKGRKIINLLKYFLTLENSYKFKFIGAYISSLEEEVEVLWEELLIVSKFTSEKKCLRFFFFFSSSFSGLGILGEKNMREKNVLFLMHEETWKEENIVLLSNILWRDLFLSFYVLFKSFSFCNDQN